MQQDYNKTLNLPKTEFPMRAGLPEREPIALKSWQEQDLYNKLMKHNEGKPEYILHDGPPYANGIIHLGTALNKSLKDFVLRYKNMTGFKAPYVPGYDTHGLPTELKARAKAGMKNAESISPIEIRKICHDFAIGFANDQRHQFERLGVLGDWDHPYLTLTNDYVARQIEVFGEMADKGYIYKGLKPVYWCPECQTALAEAEIEYADDTCYSIYVKFPVKDDKGLLSQFGDIKDKAYFVIWTTTTWTLPANLAICLGPKYNYAVVKVNDEYLIIAEELVSTTMQAGDIQDYEIVGTILGKDFEYATASHPFLDRESLIIVGDHVTLESGTGCVHTAPGHGLEDFEVCRNYKEIPIVVPVDNKGYLTEEAGEFAGLHVDDAGKPIAQKLEDDGNLFAIKKLSHQYPHCWRCKKPVLFRATEQWFCSISDFADKAVEAIKTVEWIPGWGEDRITNMIKDRSDWCISRQRTWGVPIPIFYCKDCGKEVISKETIKYIADLIRKHGPNIWYEWDEYKLMPEGITCECGCKEFKKETDIMDVWFDSGSSHAAVLDERDELHSPADLYLEGADQYRGWFQSSLLTSVATKGVSPYKTVVTHGWVVDGEGKKMSKSLGNTIIPDDIVKQFGADILRLWVASSDYHADIRVSKDILKQMSEVYRKIRNTARFILGCIPDFDPDKDSVSDDCLSDIDKYALMKLQNLVNVCRNAYDKFEYHIVYHAIHNFCVVDMSNFYLDVIKDRLYVEKVDSKTRRAAQTVIYKVLDTLTRLIAPILAFTSEEIWQFMPHSKNHNTLSVLFNEMPSASTVDADFMSYWQKVHSIRDDVKKALENARNQKIIGSSLDAHLILSADGEMLEFLNSVNNLKDIFIVSKLEIIKGDSGEFKGEQDLYVTVKAATGNKCARCWTYSDTVGKNAEHPEICERCAKVIGE